MILSNLHTHTTFCDGVSTCRETTLAAIDKGFSVLGFSGHSYTSFDTSYCMSREGTAEYYDCVEQLKNEFKDRICILKGIEYDMFSRESTAGLDFVIGSAHFIEHEGVYYPVDESFSKLKSIIESCFGGDVALFCKKYYEQISYLADNIPCDIIGHFDLITKYNELYPLIDTSSDKYRRYAVDALCSVIENKRLIEVNTGAMARGIRGTPYPDRFILEEIKNRGGSVIITSDCHSCEKLDFAFESTRQMLSEIGFKTVVVRTKNGYKEEEL